MIRNGTNTLGIIFFCLAFGTVLGSLGEKAAGVIQFFAVIDEVIVLMAPGGLIGRGGGFLLLKALGDTMKASKKWQLHSQWAE